MSLKISNRFVTPFYLSNGSRPSRGNEICITCPKQLMHECYDAAQKPALAEGWFGLIGLQKK